MQLIDNRQKKYQANTLNTLLHFVYFLICTNVYDIYSNDVCFLSGCVRTIVSLPTGHGYRGVLPSNSTWHTSNKCKYVNNSVLFDIEYQFHHATRLCKLNYINRCLEGVA